MPLSPEKLRSLADGIKADLDGELFVQDDPLLSKAPDYKVYVYNVGPTAHRIEKGSSGVFQITACPKGQPWTRCFTLPGIFRDTFKDFNDGVLKSHNVSGEFMAQDIVHPDVGENNKMSLGNNLDEYGVFWSFNAEPTAEELSVATRKMEATFRRQLAHATSLEVQGKLNDITPLMRLAATHFDEDRPWNKVYQKTGECEFCGQPAKAGIVVHSCGAVMPGMWDKAIESGLRTYEQAVAAGVKKPRKVKEADVQ